MSRGDMVSSSSDASGSHTMCSWPWALPVLGEWSHGSYTVSSLSLRFSSAGRGKLVEGTQ